MKKFPRIIDMSDFRLVKLEPTAQNAERLLAVINANREFLGEFLEWVDGYTTTDKTLANIEKSYGDDKCAYDLSGVLCERGGLGGAFRVPVVVCASPRDLSRRLACGERMRHVDLDDSDGRLFRDNLRMPVCVFSRRDDETVGN